MEEKVLFGLYEGSITPDKSVNLDGQFYERVSEGVESEVKATALAIKVGDEQGILVSCDLMEMAEGLVDAIREVVDGYNGLDASKIMLHSTHTHCSVGYAGGLRVKTKVPYGLHVLKEFTGDMKYLEMKAEHEAEMGYQEGRAFLVEKISNIIKMAWDDLHEGYYKFAFGRVAVGMNRRVVFDDGTAEMWGDTSVASFKEMEDGTDNGMEMMYIYNGDRKLEALLLNPACPAQVMEQRSVISSDYWGKVRILLKQQFGEDFKVIGVSAPAGDLCPRDLTRWVDPETPILDPNVKRPNHLSRRADPSMYDVAGTWRIAKRIVNEVNLITEETEGEPLLDKAEFKHEVTQLGLPYRKVTKSEYKEAVKAVENFVRTATSKNINFEDTAALHVYGGIMARYINQQQIDIYPAEVHVGRFGDAAFASSPFELFQNYGCQIRCRSVAPQVFQFQMTDGYLGYLPTEKAEKGGHYSAYVSSGHIGHEGGEQLVKYTVEEIRKLFPEYVPQ